MMKITIDDINKAINNKGYLHRGKIAKLISSLLEDPNKYDDSLDIIPLLKVKVNECKYISCWNVIHRYASKKAI